MVSRSVERVLEARDALDRSCARGESCGGGGDVDDGRAEALGVQSDGGRGRGFSGGAVLYELKDAPLCLFGGSGKPICAVVVVGVGGMLGEDVEVLEPSRGGKTE